MAIHNQLVQFETETQHLSADTNAEDWFSMYIWVPIVQELGTVYPTELLANLHAYILIHVGISSSDDAIQTWAREIALDARTAAVLTPRSGDAG